MATLLTKNYQQISTIQLDYGEVRTYAKYEDQSTTYNETYVKIKATYYTGQATLSFDRGTININSNATNFGYTTLLNGETDLKEISVTIQHNDDGTCPEYGVYTAWWATFGGYGETTAQIYAPTIPRASQPSINTWPQNSPDFNIGDTITIHMNRKANFTHKVYFVYGNTSYLVAQNVTDNCTFDTSLVANDLYNLIPSSNVYSNVISVQTYSGNTLVGTKTCNYNARVVNANPIFSNFEFEDINPDTITLTGDSSVNINGYSNTRITISSVNKATAQKGASMVKYRYTNGNKSTDMVYDILVFGNIDETTSGTHNVYAIDSRGNTTLVTKLSSSVIEYQNITIDKQNSSVVRTNNGVGNGATLTLNGTIWNDSFGLVTNSIKSVRYLLKKTDSSTWVTGTTTITPTLSGNTFTFTGLIASNNQDTTWDLESSYDVKVTISDELSSTTINLILNSAKPTLSLDKEGVGVMCAYDTSLGGKLQIGGKIIDGGTLLWTNPNPNNAFSSQEITLSSGDYDVLEIYYNDWNDTGSYKDLLCQKTIKGHSTKLQMQLSYNGYSYSGNRRIRYVSDTKLQVDECYAIIDNSSFNNHQVNYWNVPIYIVGYKTNLFN